MWDYLVVSSIVFSAVDENAQCDHHFQLSHIWPQFKVKQQNSWQIAMGRLNLGYCMEFSKSDNVTVLVTRRSVRFPSSHKKNLYQRLGKSQRLMRNNASTSRKVAYSSRSTRIRSQRSAPSDSSWMVPNCIQSFEVRSADCSTLQRRMLEKPSTHRERFSPAWHGAFAWWRIG